MPAKSSSAISEAKSESEVKSEREALKLDERGDKSDVIAGLIVLVGVLGALLLYTFVYSDKAQQGRLLLIGAGGSTLGWLIGIMVTPYSKEESKRLSEVARLAYGFLTGYVVSKLDRVIEHLFAGPIDGAINLLAIDFVVIGVTAFGASVGFTYISRSYWPTRSPS